MQRASWCGSVRSRSAARSGQSWMCERHAAPPHPNDNLAARMQSARWQQGRKRVHGHRSVMFGSARPCRLCMAATTVHRLCSPLDRNRQRRDMSDMTRCLQHAIITLALWFKAWLDQPASRRRSRCRLDMRVTPQVDERMQVAAGKDRSRPHSVRTDQAVAGFKVPSASHLSARPGDGCFRQRTVVVTSRRSTKTGNCATRSWVKHWRFARSGRVRFHGGAGIRRQIALIYSTIRARERLSETLCSEGYHPLSPFSSA